MLSEGYRRLINDPTRFDGVRVLGVDEHVWRHTRFGDKYVTVIIDLTPGGRRHGNIQAARHGARAFEACVQDVAFTTASSMEGGC